MTCIIAIETATEACSAALLIEKNNDMKLFKRFKLAPREHTKLILPMLEEVLNEAEIELSDIDAISFGRGPGAFTGLRIATGIAQGLALSIDKPTIPVSSLKSMALQAKDAKAISSDGSILVSIDARMGEVYWAEYCIKNDRLEMVGEEQLSTPQSMFDKTMTISQNKKAVLTGSGWDAYLNDYKKINSEKGNDKYDYISGQFPDAEHIARLAYSDFPNGICHSIEDAQPVYLRNNVAEKSKKSL